jgi:nucleotide-binding universal stress UspA family protein
MNLPIRKVLFPTDLSERGNAALELAASIARDNQASLIIAHVLERFQPMVSPAAIVPPVEHHEREEQLRRIHPEDPAVSYEHRMLQGPPATMILKLAEEESVDMIVMSTHGRTGVSRFLMGSVAEEVVRKAPCLVLTARDPLHFTAEVTTASSGS